MSNVTRTAARGTVMYMAAHACLTASGYVIAIILGRGLGPALYGAYGIVYSVLLGIELIARLGIPESLSKLIPEGHESQTDLEASGVTLTAAIYSVVFIVFFFAAPALTHLFRAPDGELFFRVAAIDIPFYGLYFVCSHILSGRRNFGVASLSLAIYAGTKTAGMFYLFAVGLSVEGALIVNAIGSAVALAFAALKTGRCSLRPTLRYGPKILRLAIPVGVFGLGTQLLPRVDLWALNAIGETVAEETKGLYVAALNLARIPNPIAFVMTAVLVPSISRALAQGDLDSARRAVSGATRFITVLLLPLCALTAIEGEILLTLVFSSDYRGAAPLLARLVVAHGFFYTLLMMWGSILIASGKEHAAAGLSLALLPAALAVAWMLIPARGAVGAAVAAVLVMAGGATLAGTLVRRHIGALVSPLVAVKALVAAGLVSLVAARLPSDGLVLLAEVVGLLLLYGLLLVVLGLLRRSDLEHLLPGRGQSSMEPQGADGES